MTEAHADAASPISPWTADAGLKREELSRFCEAEGLKKRAREFATNCFNALHFYKRDLELDLEDRLVTAVADDIVKAAKSALGFLNRKTPRPGAYRTSLDRLRACIQQYPHLEVVHYEFGLCDQLVRVVTLGPAAALCFACKEECKPACLCARDIKPFEPSFQPHAVWGDADPVEISDLDPANYSNPEAQRGLLRLLQTRFSLPLVRSAGRPQLSQTELVRKCCVAFEDCFDRRARHKTNQLAILVINHFLEINGLGHISAQYGMTRYGQELAEQARRRKASGDQSDLHNLCTF